MTKVKVFTTQTCSYCPSVKKYLDMKKVDYEIVDVTTDIDLIKEASSHSGAFTVPQTLFQTETEKMVVVGPNYGSLAKGIALTQ